MGFQTVWPKFQEYQTAANWIFYQQQSYFKTNFYKLIICPIPKIWAFEQ